MPPEREEEQAPSLPPLPPLPARLRPLGSVLPDDVAGMLASSLTSAAGAGANNSEQPSRQMSLDALAALLQLPQSISSAAQGGQAAIPLPPLPDRQRDGFQRQDRRQRGENHSQPPSPKRAKTADSQMPARAPQLVQQQLMLGFPSGPLAAQHQLQGHGRGWQAAGLAQLLGTAASQPPSLRGTPPPGGGSAPASPRQQAAGRQGEHQAFLEPGLGGLSEDPAAPGVAQQQLLLALLSMLPEEQRGARPETAPPAPGPGTPRTTSSDHKAAGTSAAAGGTDSPVSAPHGCLPQRSGELPLLVGCAASPAAEAAAADAALASAPAEPAAHQLCASAVAAPMPPLPPASPEAAAAAAAARAGLPMSPQQRQAVFEHSGTLHSAPLHQCVQVCLPAWHPGSEAKAAVVGLRRSHRPPGDVRLS